MYSLICIIILSFSSIILTQKQQPLIINEYFSDLKSKDHPFKNWSVRNIQIKLGLLKSKYKSPKQILYGDNSGLPEEFDSRTQWPNCIHAIRNQLQCGSCWAFSASEILSDRFCIASSGKTNVILSPQDLVSCDTQDLGCVGGEIDKSWDYIRDVGIVSDECLPYSSGDGKSNTCPFTTKRHKCQKGTYTKYQVSSHNQHLTIADAKKAIITGGPIEAGFDVYDDFISYAGGVYRKTSYNILGGHAVKVVGWGKDTDGTEYWLVANSWDTTWGDEGYFRIAFGECNFEDELWSGNPLIKNLEHNPFFLELI